MGFDRARLDSIALGGESGLVDGPFGSNLPATAYVAAGIPVIRGSNLSKGEVRFKGDEFVFVSEETASRLARSFCKADDIIFTKKGTLGQVGIVPKDGYAKYLLSSNQMRLRIDPAKADADFVYYALSSPESINRLLRDSEHTGVPKINLAYIRQFRIPLPSLPKQHAIARLLCALDEHCELLRQTNTTAEAIAQTLFKSWFVDFDPVRAKAEGREPEGMDAATAALFPSEFEDSELGPIPKGWRVGNLGQCCDNVRSQAKPGTLDPATPYIGLEHMPRGSIVLSEWGAADGLASGKFRYQPNDVLFGKLRPYFHKVGVASHEGVCSTDILVIRTKKPTWFSFSAMHFSSDALISYATQLSNGAKMPRTNWHDLAACKVAMPDDASASAFDAVVRPMIGRIHAAIEAMRSVGDLRDTLLPRLISGKLRLPEATEICKGSVEGEFLEPVQVMA